MTTAKTVGTIVGNPRAGSRTSQIAATVAARIVTGLGDSVPLAPVELGAHGAALLDPAAAEVDRDRDAMADVDVLVVASPTYKATYTGLLKAFVDRYPTDGLAGVVAVPLMVGGAPHHALATEVYLRPLLVELGATVPGQGLYVVDSQMGDLEATVEGWWERSGPAIRAAVLGRGVDR